MCVCGGGSRLRRATLPAVDSWARLSQERGNLLDQVWPLGASDPDGASGCGQGLGPVGPQNQSQLSRPVFSKGWLLKTGSPPRKQMFSTMLTKRNNESGTQARDAPSPSCWPRNRGQLRNQAERWHGRGLQSTAPAPGRACGGRLLRLLSKILFRGFPGGAVVENLPANAGNTGSSPRLGRSHMPRSN